MADDLRVYVIVPRCLDLPTAPFKLNMTCGRMAGQVGHVCGVLQEAERGPFIQFVDLIVLQVASSHELENALNRLINLNIEFVSYFDEDKSFDGKVLTAIATFPLNKDQQKVLKHLRPWKCACNEVENTSKRLPSAADLDAVAEEQAIADATGHP